MSEKQRSHREKGLMAEHLLIQLTRGHFQWPLIVGRDPDPSSVVLGFPDDVREIHIPFCGRMSLPELRNEGSGSLSSVT